MSVRVQAKGVSAESVTGRVLVVEDDDSLSEVIGLVLGAAGMDVTAVASGSQAVEVFDPKSSLGWAPLAATGDADVLAALREATRQDFAEIVGDIPAEEVERGEDGSERDDEDEQDEEQDDEEYEAGVHGEVVVQGWSATVIERSSNAQSLANRSVARLGAARGRGQGRAGMAAAVDRHFDAMLAHAALLNFGPSPTWGEGGAQAARLGRVRD